MQAIAQGQPLSIPPKLPSPFRLRNTSCHFLRRADFLAIVHTWLFSQAFHHVVTLNAEMVVEAEHNEIFQRVLAAAEIKIPEAGPLWAYSYLTGSRPLWLSLLQLPFRHLERLTGIDSIIALCALCVREKKSIYLLGGSVTETEGARQELIKQFPDLEIFTGPPHRYALEGPSYVLSHINACRPAVLFVAYGAPRQSIWIDQQGKHLPSVRIAMGVGGAFAMLSHKKPRAPKFLQRHQLEWVWRLLLEPTRIVRMWRAVVVFPWLIYRQKHFQGFSY